MYLEEMTVQLLLTVLVLVQLAVNLKLMGIIAGVDMFTFGKKKDKVTEQHPVEVPDEHPEAVNLFDSIDESDRNKSFDERISAMKNQMGMQHGVVPRPTHTAEELDPNVKNLPHSIIPDTHTNAVDNEIAK